MAIEREAVQGMGQAPATVKRGFKRLASKTPQRLPDVGVPQGTQVMEALARASGILATEAGKHFQRKIAEDTVKQQSLAMRNLEPSDDATVAGYRAHSIIGMQNNVLSKSKEIEAEAATFQGTDDEWDEYLGSSFSEMHDNYLLEHPSMEGDVDALGAMNALFGEQLPRLGIARVSGKLEQEHIKRQKTFQDNILLRLEGLDGENLTMAANAFMVDGADALKLTVQEREAMLGQAAMNAAKGGDLRLLNYTKEFTGDQESSMFERSAGLQAAEREALKLNNSTDVAALSAAQAVNTEDLMKGNIDSDGFRENAGWIGGYTVSGINSEIARVARVKIRQQEVEALLEYASPARPVAPADEKPVMAALIAKHKKVLDDAIAADPDSEGAATAKMQQDVDKEMGEKGLVDPYLREQLLDLINLDTDKLEGERLQGDMRNLVSRFNNMSSGSQLAHSNPKTVSIMKNTILYQQQHKTEVQALTKAIKAVRNPPLIDAETRTKAIKSAREAADEMTDWTWMPNWMGGHDTQPGWMREQRRDFYEQATIANMEGGTIDHSDALQAVKDAEKEWWTTIENGQMLFGKRQQLAEQMGVSYTTRDEITGEIIDRGDDISGTLEIFKQMHATELAVQVGDLDNVQFETIPGMGTIVLRNALTGDRIMGPLPLSELRRGRDAYNEQLLIDQQEQARLSSLAVSTDGKVTEVREVVQARTFSFNVPDDRPDRVMAFTDTLKTVENAARDGFDPQTGGWSPHASPEGGTDTLAYGHKLTLEEQQSGVIYIEGKSYPHKPGDSTVTDEVADTLLDQDLSKAEDTVKKNWKGYADLPWEYQKVLTNLQFNASRSANVSKKSWPDLAKAMTAGDDEAVRKEMLAHYVLDGEKHYLVERTDKLADSLGIAVSE